jgi:hypothetical protein
MRGLNSQTNDRPCARFRFVLGYAQIFVAGLGAAFLLAGISMVTRRMGARPSDQIVGE